VFGCAENLPRAVKQRIAGRSEGMASWGMERKLARAGGDGCGGVERWYCCCAQQKVSRRGSGRRAWRAFAPRKTANELRARPERHEMGSPATSAAWVRAPHRGPARQARSWADAPKTLCPWEHHIITSSLLWARHAHTSGPVLPLHPSSSLLPFHCRCAAPWLLRKPPLDTERRSIPGIISATL
jgi:hypothetical protein